jgi:alkylation response protein AidB-like acyl-CoA dehydrogenase
MHIEFTPEQENLRQEIRRYYRELFTPELRAAFEAERCETGGPVFCEIVGRMGHDGWLGIGWPAPYGGQGRTPIEQCIFWDETYRARAPLPIIQVNSIGPTLMEFGTDAQIETWMGERARVALAATQVGVSERALELTTRYLCEREQFGAPLGALQAVQQRCADCFIDLECLRSVTWKAAYELAQERPAAREAWIAKSWAAEAGSRIATATQHLHGGMGADVDYPIHRHFLWSKSLELALGGALPQLAALGRDMARTGPEARE